MLLFNKEIKSNSAFNKNDNTWLGLNDVLGTMSCACYQLGHIGTVCDQITNPGLAKGIDR